VAEITKKRQGEMLRAVFDGLIANPEGVSAKDALSRAAKSLILSEYEKGTYTSTPNSTRFEKIVRFSTIWPVKAGWMVKAKGKWKITDEGKRAYAKYTDPEEFAREVVKLYQRWAQARSEVTAEDINSETVQANITLEQAEEDAWDAVQTFLQAINPYDLQELVAALLRAMGYHVAWVSPPGKDGGLDILAYTVPFGASGPRVKVQVKRRADRVSVDGLRAFLALLGDLDVGLFVSTGGFTTDAENEARTQEKRRITLIDSEKLFDLWTEYFPKLKESEKQLLPITPVYFLNPPE